MVEESRLKIEYLSLQIRIQDWEIYLVFLQVSHKNEPFMFYKSNNLFRCHEIIKLNKTEAAVAM
jgi:hypothetical protein